MVRKLRDVESEGGRHGYTKYKTLQPLGAGYQVIDMGVRSVLKELNQYQGIILAEAQRWARGS